MDVMWSSVWVPDVKGFRPLTKAELQERKQTRVAKICEGNYVENLLITLVDGHALTAIASVQHDITWKERSKSYATGHVCEVDSTRTLSGLFKDTFNESKQTKDDPRESHTREPKWFRAPLSKMHGPSFPRDLYSGATYERPLYSYSNDALERYCLERQMRPVRLPWSSQTHPGLYEPVIRTESKSSLRAYVEMWSPYPNGEAYSRPVRLWPGILRFARAWLNGLRVIKQRSFVRRFPLSILAPTSPKKTKGNAWENGILVPQT